MKANRKFKEEAGVSAVIGVILMVAISVAIAATVYVYVSGIADDTEKARYYDNENIMVQLEQIRGEDDILTLTIFSRENYTIHLFFIDGDDKLKSKTLEFSICDIPYQYEFASKIIKDYDLLIVKEEG